MSLSIFANAPAEKYLLVPAHPVPNGMLHLGHMAGPYLHLDWLARHLRRRGDRVWVISGSDPFEPFLTIRAEQEARDPVDLALEYHDRIVRDFKALDIGLDAFVNPVGSEWAERYAGAYNGLLRQLQSAGRAEQVRETLCFSPRREKFEVGCWLLGRCPGCGADSGGFTCEDCGAHYQALVEPRGRRGDPLETREADNLFFRIGEDEGKAVLRQLEAGESPQQFRELCARNLRHQSPLLRLPIADSWGLPGPAVGDDGHPRALVGQGFLLAYSRLCGEAYCDLTGDSLNPFDAGSPVMTVNGFGIDNVVTHMVGIQAVAMALGMKPYDRFVVNHFYLLEGEKFSTSRRHVIWAGDLVEQTPAASDAVRYFLAATSPTHQRENFDVQKFLRVSNERLGDELVTRLEQAFGSLEENFPEGPGDGFIERLRSGLAEHEAAFAFRSFDPQRAVAALDAWERDGAGTPYWWLKGYALLAEPLMPKLAGEIWSALGGGGRPTTGEFLEPSRPRADRGFSRFEAVSLAELAPCLPDTLES